MAADAEQAMEKSVQAHAQWTGMKGLYPRKQQAQQQQSAPPSRPAADGPGAGTVEKPLVLRHTDA